MNTRTQPPRRPDVDDDDPTWDFIVALARPIAGTVGLVVRHSWISLVALVAVAVWCWFGSWASVAVVAAVVVALGVWRVLWPVSFDRLVTARRGRARRRRVYQRAWFDAVTAAGLVSTRRNVDVVPELRAVRCGRFFDRLEVRLAPGQTPGLLEEAAESLAHVFGVASCRIRRLRPGVVVVELGHGEALAGVVDALAIADEVDLRAVPVGVTERGSVWTLPVLGSHLLVVGMTHAGKSSVIWSMLRGLAGPIAAGSVRVVCMDPKGGMELAAGAPLFSRFETDFDSIADALDQAVELMTARTRRLRGITRTLEPSIDEPLVVIVVDELASLTAYQPDRKLRDRINNALALLCTQGRSAGVCVVAAVQDPRKEVVSIRDLFPTKVALRLGSAVQVEMVLGDGARARGARCDEIARSTPGVGYVLVEGEIEPVRVRAAYVSDDDITAMAAEYSAPLVLEDQP